MSDQLNRETPLHYVLQQSTGSDRLSIKEITDYGHLDLRGDSNDPAFVQGIAQVTGIELPTAPSTWASEHSNALFWLGPDQWLLLVPHGTQAEMEAALREKLSGHFAITDISSAQTVVELSGEGTEQALRMASPYDMDKLTVGRAVQTVYAKTGVTLWRHNDAVRMIVRRSFADYMHRWTTTVAA